MDHKSVEINGNYDLSTFKFHFYCPECGRLAATKYKDSEKCIWCTLNL